MKAYLQGIIIIISICISSCNNGSNTYESESYETPKSPEELKAELLAQEEDSPESYISTSNVTLQPQKKKIRNAGLFRDAEYAPDGAIIEGNFVSTATLAKYKDMKVKISYYSQTKTVIEEKHYVLYHYLDPNSTKHFSMRIDRLPQAYDGFGFEVIGATPVTQ